LKQLAESFENPCDFAYLSMVQTFSDLRWFAGVRVRLPPFGDFASAMELDMTLDEIALLVESTESSQPVGTTILFGVKRTSTS
jgi:hypothetical protein